MSRGSVSRDRDRWGFVVDVGRDLNGRRSQHRRRGFRTRKEALAALAEVQAQVRTGTFVEPTHLTVVDYLVGTWLPAIRASVRASTWDSYRRNIQGHVLPQLGSHRLQALSAADLNAL